MLTSRIQLADRYDYLNERFQKAFAFLRGTNLSALPAGRVEIDGDLVFAQVQSYTTMTPEECPFESHRDYFDLQYVVEGEEVFGYEPQNRLTPSMEYDEERDLIFYKEPVQSGSVVMKPGDFAIVPPEDGHAPRRMTSNGPCLVKKIVVKIRTF